MLAPGYEVVDLLDLDAAEPFPLAPVLLATLLERLRPDLRRDDRALAPVSKGVAERRSAPWYIGDESKRRMPDGRAALTTSAARSASDPNVFQVPRPITGPRRRSSIKRAQRPRARE